MHIRCPCLRPYFVSTCDGAGQTTYAIFAIWDESGDGLDAEFISHVAGTWDEAQAVARMLNNDYELQLRTFAF